MFVSDNYKSDILSNNTKITPVIVIEKQIGQNDWEYYSFSTKSMEILIVESGGELRPIHCEPYLLSVPKVKDSIDVFTHKYKTSNIKLELSNAEYNGKRIADIFENTKVANIDISIYYKSPTTSRVQPFHLRNQYGNNYKDCLKIYTGKVRDINFTTNKINLSLEDLSSAKIHKNLPKRKVGTESHPKYRDKYIPIVYGNVISPLIQLDTQTFVSDTEPIYGYNQDSYRLDALEEPQWLYYNSIYIYYKKEYISLARNVYYKFVTQETIDGLPNPNYTDINLGYSQYTINNDNEIIIPIQGLRSINRIQCVYDGRPSDIKLLRYDYKGGSEGNANQSGYDLIGREGFQKIITDGQTHNVIDMMECKADIRPVFIDNSTDQWFDYPIPCWLFQWNYHNENTEWSILLETKLNDALLPTPGDTSEYQTNVGTDGWYVNYNVESEPFAPSVWLGDNRIGLNAINPNQTFRTDNNPYNSNTALLYEFELSQVVPLAGNAIWWASMHTTSKYQNFINNICMASGNSYSSHQGGQVNWNNVSSILYCDDQIAKANSDPNNFTYRNWNDNADFKLQSEMPYSPDNASTWQHDCAPVLRFSQGKHVYADFDSSSDDNIERQPSNYYNIGIFGCVHYDNSATNPSTNTGNSTLTSDYRMHMNFDIKNVEVKSVVDYDEADEKEFYGNIYGRTDDELINYPHENMQPDYWGEYLSNPIDIIRHIAKIELGIEHFDEDEFKIAWEEHRGQQFAFAVIDEINSKKLLEKISESTFSYPRIKSDGSFGFTTIKETYNQDDYENAITIDEKYIIRNSFKLSSPNKVISKLTMSWGKDYAMNKYTNHYEPSPSQSSTIYNITQMDNEYGTPSKNFSGIENQEDNHKHFKSDYFQGIGYSNIPTTFRKRKFENEKVQHLICKIELPLQYSYLEIGDLIKFPKDRLIDNIKPHGIDYTNPIAFGGSVRYPLFLITSISRSLNGLAIEGFQLHSLATPYHSPIEVDPYKDTTNDAFWGQDGFFENSNYIDPFRLINWETPPEIELPEPPQLTGQMLIGYNSQFSPNDDLQLDSSYSRRFHIHNNQMGEDGFGEGAWQYWFWYTETDPLRYDNINYYFSDWENELYGPARFGLNSYMDLVPEKNNDNSGYGSILNGLGDEQVGGFIAMTHKVHVELEMGSYGYNDAPYDQKIELRNIAGTIFDEESGFYDPSAIIPDTWNECIIDYDMHSTEIRLDWVGFRGDGTLIFKTNPIIIEEFQGEDPLLGMNPIRKSQKYLLMTCNAYSTDLGGEDGLYYSHSLTLYPRGIPNEMSNLTLAYNGVWNLQLFKDLFAAGNGDSNLDGNLNVLDVVGTVAHILGNGELSQEGQQVADFNGDGSLNVLDVVLTVSHILGND